MQECLSLQFKALIPAKITTFSPSEAISNKSSFVAEDLTIEVAFVVINTQHLSTQHSQIVLERLNLHLLCYERPVDFMNKSGGACKRAFFFFWNCRRKNKVWKGLSGVLLIFSNEPPQKSCFCLWPKPLQRPGVLCQLWKTERMQHKTWFWRKKI